MPFTANGEWQTDDTAPGRASDFDEGLADVPVLGWLFGSTGRRDAARNAADQQRGQRAFESLLGTMPSEDEIAVEYAGEGTTDEFGNLLGGPSQLEGFQRDPSVAAALRQLQQWGTGEMTGADRAQANMLREGTAQQFRGNNQAALQQASARGMLGGGGQLAAQLGGAEALAGARGAQDAGLQAAIQQRALGALQTGGQLGLQAGSQDLARRQALDAYNQQQLDWRRGRGQRNTMAENRTRESRSNAAQQAYENRERGAAGVAGQWQASQDNRRADRSSDAIGTIAGEVIKAYTGASAAGVARGGG